MWAKVEISDLVRSGFSQGFNKNITLYFSPFRTWPGLQLEPVLKWQKPKHGICSNKINTMMVLSGLMDDQGCNLDPRAVVSCIELGSLWGLARNNYSTKPTGSRRRTEPSGRVSKYPNGWWSCDFKFVKLTLSWHRTLQRETDMTRFDSGCTEGMPVNEHYQA
jgi:hypothetical protein